MGLDEYVLQRLVVGCGLDLHIRLVCRDIEGRDLQADDGPKREVLLGVLHRRRSGVGLSLVGVRARERHLHASILERGDDADGL